MPVLTAGSALAFEAVKDDVTGATGGGQLHGKTSCCPFSSVPLLTMLWKIGGRISIRLRYFKAR